MGFKSDPFRSVILERIVQVEASGRGGHTDIVPIVADQRAHQFVDLGLCALIDFRVGSGIIGFVVDDHNLGVTVQTRDQVFEVTGVLLAEDD